MDNLYDGPAINQPLRKKSKSISSSIIQRYPFTKKNALNQITSQHQNKNFVENISDLCSKLNTLVKKNPYFPSVFDNEYIMSRLKKQKNRDKFRSISSLYNKRGSIGSLNLSNNNLNNSKISNNSGSLENKDSFFSKTEIKNKKYELLLNIDKLKSSLYKLNRYKNNPNKINFKNLNMPLELVKVMVDLEKTNGKPTKLNLSMENSKMILKDKNTSSTTTLENSKNNNINLPSINTNNTNNITNIKNNNNNNTNNKETIKKKIIFNSPVQNNVSNKQTNDKISPSPIIPKEKTNENKKIPIKSNNKPALIKKHSSSPEVRTLDLHQVSKNINHNQENNNKNEVIKDKDSFSEKDSSEENSSYNNPTPLASLSSLKSQNKGSKTHKNTRNPKNKTKTVITSSKFSKQSSDSTKKYSKLFHNFSSKCNEEVKIVNKFTEYINNDYKDDKKILKKEEKNYKESMLEIFNNLNYALKGSESGDNYIKNLIGPKEIFIMGGLYNKKNAFLKQHNRMEAIPKISEKLAFYNRSHFFDRFQYNYDNEEDFIIDTKKKYNNKKYKEKKFDDRCKIDYISHLMDTDIKGKELLMKRIKDNQAKFIEGVYAEKYRGMGKRKGKGSKSMDNIIAMEKEKLKRKGDVKEVKEGDKDKEEEKDDEGSNNTNSSIYQPVVIETEESVYDN